MIECQVGQCPLGLPAAYLGGNNATFENRAIATPTGCSMLNEQYVEIALGERVVIVGGPGTGKTPPVPGDRRLVALGFGPSRVAFHQS